MTLSSLGEYTSGKQLLEGQDFDSQPFGRVYQDLGEDDHKNQYDLSMIYSENLGIYPRFLSQLKIKQMDSSLMEGMTCFPIGMARLQCLQKSAEVLDVHPHQFIHFMLACNHGHSALIDPEKTHFC